MEAWLSVPGALTSVAWRLTCTYLLLPACCCLLSLRRAVQGNLPTPTPVPILVSRMSARGSFESVEHSMSCDVRSVLERSRPDAQALTLTGTATVASFSVCFGLWMTTPMECLQM